jgi:hypothetical protein
MQNVRFKWNYYRYYFYVKGVIEAQLQYNSQKEIAETA